MSFKYLNLSGLEDLWINIKNYILSKVPTKTSELTNDSGYLTSHQSLDNYVTLNTNQTITAIKTITGGNQGKMVFKNPNYTKGDAVESGTIISRLYFGNGTSYATANGILTFDINSSGNTFLELAALNNTASSSYRASLIITYDKSATRTRILKSYGDFIPYSNNNYTLGNASNIWKECYSNAYYLGSTAFGDIVTHNASEFLTDVSDASVANADEFSTNQDVTLTGDVTGTASSKAGWSISTTLSDSGVTAGTYGPSTDVTGSNNTTILVPEITVDTKGRITNVTNRTYTSVNTDSDKKCYQYYKSDNNVYRVMFSNVTGNTATSNVGANYACLNNAFYANPSTGAFYATKVYSGGTEVSVSGHTHSSSDITDIDDYATKDYVDNSISGLVDNAPDALNTLNELSAALNDDSNFASTVTTALAAKANSADLATVATSGSYTDLTDKPSIPSKISDLIDDSNIPWQTIPNVYSRNEPVVTDILWSGNLNQGDITLSKPFIDYDVLMFVYGTNDNSPGTAPWNFSVIPVWMMKKVIVDKNVFGVVPTTFDIVNDHERRWEIVVADSHFTFLKYNYDANVKMWRVIGIRYTTTGTGVV